MSQGASPSGLARNELRCPCPGLGHFLCTCLQYPLFGATEVSGRLGGVGPGQECLFSNWDLEAGFLRKLGLGVVPWEVDPVRTPWETHGPPD